jgi:hypothetical protein
MRSRKEIIYLNIKDLTEEEIEKLGDMELNSCDKCGEIDMSDRLNWIEGIEGEYYEQEQNYAQLIEEGCVAVCDDCLSVPKPKV